jgi:hypothetical protein
MADLKIRKVKLESRKLKRKLALASVPARENIVLADLARHVANSYTAVVEKTVKGKDASGAYNSASVWVKQDGKWVTVVHSEAKAR